MIRRIGTAIVIVTALLFLMASLEDVGSRPTTEYSQ